MLKNIYIELKLFKSSVGLKGNILGISEGKNYY